MNTITSIPCAILKIVLAIFRRKWKAELPLPIGVPINCIYSFCPVGGIQSISQDPQHNMRDLWTSGVISLHSNNKWLLHTQTHTQPTRVMQMKPGQNKEGEKKWQNMYTKKENRNDNISDIMLGNRTHTFTCKVISSRVSEQRNMWSILMLETILGTYHSRYIALLKARMKRHDKNRIIYNLNFFS